MHRYPHFLLWALAVVGCAGSGTVLGDRFYSDTEYSFKVELPENYRLQAGGQSSKDRLVATKEFGVESGAVRPNFLFTVYLKTENQYANLKEFATKHFDDFVFELIDERNEMESTIAERPAWLISYITKRASGNIVRKRGMNAYLETTRYYLVVAYTAGMGTYDRRQFSDVLNTLEIDL